MKSSTFVLSLLLYALLPASVAAAPIYLPGCGKEVHVQVFIKTQTLGLYHGCLRVFEARVSTAKPGKRTPKGLFSVGIKDKWHRSNLFCKSTATGHVYRKKPTQSCRSGYKGYPMFRALHVSGPYWIHIGKLPDMDKVRSGFGLSSGCVRVSEEAGEYLFSVIEIRTAVIIQ